MLARNGAGLAAARTANEARKIVGTGKRDGQSSNPSSPKPQSAIRAELIAHVRYALAEAAETDGEVAYDIVETVITHVIKALRADPGIPARSLTDWELALADAVNRATFDLRHLDGLINPREAIWAIEDFLAEHSTMEHWTAST